MGVKKTLEECVPDSTGLVRDEMLKSGAELVRYRRHGLISTCAYFPKLQGNMRLIPNMRLTIKVKI